MASNDNTVNIKEARSGYHHGDLRAAVIEEGLRLLETGTADTLSLREVARNVGVSAPAVYRHFPDKAAFLKALAKEGLAQLAAAQAAAAQGRGAGGFAESGRAYVRFALANPGLFRLVFTTNTGSPPDLANDPEGSAGWQLHRHVTGAIGGGAGEAAVRVLAYRAWSLVHGLAMLVLDGQIARDEAEAMIGQIIDDHSLGK